MAAVVGWTLLGAGPAGASPVTVWLEPDNGLGLDDASVADFVTAAGASSVDEVTIVFTPMQAKVGVFDVFTPDPFDSCQPGFFPTGDPSCPSGPIDKSNPSTAFTTWDVSLTAMGQSMPPGARIWMLFLRHSPTDPHGTIASGGDGHYSDSNLLGFEVDPMSGDWALFQPAGMPDIYYLAYHIGVFDDAADTAQVPIDYRVAQLLFDETPGGDVRNFRMHKLDVAFAVPEPGTFLMVGLGVLVLAVRRQR